ncbi:MAG: ABC transporter ATP-binding protein [Chloroflexi bacterium]|nr:ABC transporter ATP-binding protein [Chloroflexota bacterium]
MEPNVDDKILQVTDLRMHFFVGQKVVRAVDGVSFDLKRGKTLAIVGESGAGKTATGMTILRLHDKNLARILSGRIMFDGKDLAHLSERALRDIRGNRIAMIYQDPLSALNPSLRVGDQIAEAITEHQSVSKREALRRVARLLDEVGIHTPEVTMRAYPHELSGGMRQRAIIATAVACQPSILIADEPTTALDTTIQAQILELLKQLQREHSLSIVLITHDLGVVASTAHDVLVMYAGKPVEATGVREAFYNPLHPYTQGLLRSVFTTTLVPKEPLKGIAGVPPRLDQEITGCSFAPRCARRGEVCARERPELRELQTGHRVSCHFAGRATEEGIASAAGVRIV